MTGADPANSTGGAGCNDERPPHGIAKWLGLAATPTFATMALLTSAHGGSPMDLLCSASHTSPLTGMLPMYLLMSLFHSAPWFEAVSTVLGVARPNRRGRGAVRLPKHLPPRAV